MRQVDIPDPNGLNSEQRLALAYAPAVKRDALSQVWTLDARMRLIFTATREPAITQIKLAWWQERLAELGVGEAPPEPLLRSLVRVARDGDATRRLCALAGAWRCLVDEWSDTAIDAYAADRGGSLLLLAGTILGAEPSPPLVVAAEAMALADLSVLAPSARRDAVAARARLRFNAAGNCVWPRVLRPLGMLILLSRRDLLSGDEPPRGSPARVARMAWHAISGR